MTRFVFAVLIGCGANGTALAGSVVPITPRLPQSALASLTPAADDVTDPAALAKRIAENVRTAGDKLRDRDTGADTRNAQTAALRDIDKLLDRAENPPMSCPMPMGGSGGEPPPMAGAGQPKPMPGQGKGQQPSPKGGSGKSGGSRPSWRDKGGPGDAPMGEKPMGGQPKPDQSGKEPGPKPDPSKPMGGQPGQPGDRPGGTKPDGSPGQPDAKPAMPFDDAVTKQVWGHLPERLRQEVNQYYKEQFMPKYGDLLKQYYADLAERDKSGRRQ